MAEPLPAFVLRRRPDWTELEVLLARHRDGALRLADLSALDRLYRRAAADLALAQTFYSGTDAHRFLNHLTARAYASIYRRRDDRRAALARFYRVVFPRTVRETLPYTALAAALLLLGALLGATTVAFEPDGARLLLPDTLREVIERRELWTDSALSSHAPSEMATAVFTNNLRVSFLAFALGVTAGIGTVLLMLVNGLHLGAVVAACAQAGLAPGILDFMAAHGPVELSIISLTGGAGLVLGHAMFADDERPRREILSDRAQVAVRLVLGCAPFLTGIGLIEGFISPGPLFPWPLKAALGAGLGVAFWAYLLRSGK
jgi:uncharacterized membrane protein SpoIIM required for sporulation